ncbi:tetratricopeptide repeat protein [Candidatus Latescibacterota bacterium]
MAMRTTYILLFLLSIAIPVHTQVSNRSEQVIRYNEAGNLYRNGQFTEALTLYEELIQSGIKNSELYYNTSNSAYRAGHTGKAILYLERALKLSPSDKDAHANLAYLNSIKMDQEPENSNVLLTFAARRYNAININAAAIWSGLTFAMAMICATAALFTKEWKRITTSSLAGVCLFVCIVSTGVLIQKLHYNATVVEAVIMSEEAEAYSGPGTENTHVFTIHTGTKVIIERGQYSWNLIRLKSGAGGWIQADLMEII